MKLLITMIFVFLIVSVSFDAFAADCANVGITFDLTHIVLKNETGKTIGDLGFSMHVTGVATKSQADLAGIKAGDTIISINDVPLKDLGDELELFVLFYKAPTNELQIDVLREIKKFDPDTPGPIDPREYYGNKKVLIRCGK